MHHDDRFTRRTALGALAGLGAALAGLPAGAVPDCVISPELTAGPFFVDEHLNRSDVTADTELPGVRNAVPLRLALRVYANNAGRCAPLAGAHVDLWNADALGTYSDVDGARGQRFLRGYQVTGRDGAVAFTTVHPGWYPSRTPHVHVLVRTYARGNDVTHSFATQLFFDDAINDTVLASAAYRPHGARDTRNANDAFYTPKTLVPLKREGRGYAGTFTLGVRFG